MVIDTVMASVGGFLGSPMPRRTQLAKDLHIETDLING